MYCHVELGTFFFLGYMIKKFEKENSGFLPSTTYVVFTKSIFIIVYYCFKVEKERNNLDIEFKKKLLL